MIQITCITKDGGNHENQHTAISRLGWVDVHSRQQGNSSRLEIYDFLKKGGQAYVTDISGRNTAYLMTAETAFGTKYVKTIPDQTKTDNLLNLPECVR